VSGKITIVHAIPLNAAAARSGLIVQQVLYHVRAGRRVDPRRQLMWYFLATAMQTLSSSSTTSAQSPYTIPPGAEITGKPGHIDREPWP